MQQCILVYLCCLIISLFGITSSFYIRPMMTTEDDIDLDLRLILKGSMLGKLKKRNYDTLQQTLRKHHGYYRYRPDNFIDRLFQMFDRNDDGCIQKKEFETIIGFIIS